MRHARRITAGLLALAIVGQTAFADQPRQDEKVDRKTIDAALYNTLREVINKGADMYNNGDMTGCYRLFEGALLTAKPMLDHRPELQKSIAKALSAAERDAVAYRRAFALRAALDKVRVELNPNPKKDDKLPPAKVEEKKDDKEKADKEKADKEMKDKEKADKEKADKEKADKEKKDKEADKEKADKTEKLRAPKSDPDDV